MSLNLIDQDSLAVAAQTLESLPLKSQEASNPWMWVAIAEFVLILMILVTLKFKSTNDPAKKFKKDALDQDVDFNNILNSSFNSGPLYKDLKVKCHPDRFATNPELNAIADELFQEITRNKLNLKKLNELKLEAEQKLNIKF